MPANKTTSPLAKKYGQKRVVLSRNLVQARAGIKPGSERAKDKIPWGLVGKIAQDEKKAGKNIKKSDIDKAKKEYKKKGKSPLIKRYMKEGQSTKSSTARTNKRS